MIRRLSAWRGVATAAAIAAAVAAVPAPALAASGTTVLELNGHAAKSLRGEGIEISPLRPARGGERRISLPVRSGLAGASTTVLTHGGGISFEAKQGKAVRLTKFRLLLGKRSRLSAKLGGREIDVFALAGKSKADVDSATGTVELAGMRLRLTRAGARAIGERLAADVQRGNFGTLSSRVSSLPTPGAAPEDEDVVERARGCPLPSGAGPTPEDPLPVATRPPGAVDVISATIDWHVRESFIRYIAGGEGTSVSGGATADPPVLLPGSSTALTYDFHFPFASGWHDAGANLADPADDRTAIYFGGAVRFLYSGHEIDLTTSAPEIELSGGASRAIFAIAEGAEPATRQVLVNLDLSRAGAISASGNTHTYERVPGAIPSGTAGSVFAGFYAPGTEFGCFRVSYTTS